MNESKTPSILIKNDVINIRRFTNLKRLRWGRQHVHCSTVALYLYHYYNSPTALMAKYRRDDEHPVWPVPILYT